MSKTEAKPAATRIYRVTDGKSTRLVRAASQAQAIRHVTEPVYKAEPVSVEDAIALAHDGVMVESAKEPE